MHLKGKYLPNFLTYSMNDPTVKMPLNQFKSLFLFKKFEI